MESPLARVAGYGQPCDARTRRGGGELRPAAAAAASGHGRSRGRAAAGIDEAHRRTPQARCGSTLWEPC
jgi:hypothetical protein